MSYIDLLDTVKSAHPNKLVSDWWRISSHEMQANAIALAKTELMIRLLHGETILVTNTQSFDSVAFLDTAAELTRFAFLERPPLALPYFKVRKEGVAYPTEWAPEVLVDLSIEYLENNNFISSAWIGLDNNIRSNMSTALRSSNDASRFISMVENVYLDIDPKLRDDYRKQARNLQIFYDYLRNLHNQGKYVVRKAGSPNRLIWNDLDDLRFSSLKGVPLDAIAALGQEINNQNLQKSREDRSVLYSLIENFDLSLRDTLRKYIDIYYNQKVGSSVSPRGRGTYTVTDHNPETPMEQDEQLLERAESINATEGIFGEIALKVLPDQAASINSLTWDDVERVLREEKSLRDSAYNLQANLAQYNRLDAGQPDYANKYREWKQITDEALEKHHFLLSRLLAPKIKYDSVSRRFVSFVSPLIGSVGGTVTGAMVAYAFQNPVVGVLASVATAEVLSYILASISTKAGEYDLETSAAGSIHESLQKSVKIPRLRE